MNVFISYRRSDSYWPAQKISAELSKLIPQESIFIDVDSIPAGIDYGDYIRENLNQTDILIAVIGTRWVSELNADTGLRRIFEPDDFVRLEIEEALSRNIKVVPTLVDGAQLPSVDSIPESISGLLRRNGEVINNQSFELDCQRLFKKVGITKETLLSRVGQHSVVAAVAIGALATASLFAWNSQTTSGSQSEVQTPEGIAIELVRSKIGPLKQNAEDLQSKLVQECYQLAGHNLDPNLPAGVIGKTVTELGAVAEKAEESCGSALQSDPSNPELLWLFARIQAARGERTYQVDFLNAASDLGSVSATVTLAIRFMEGRGVANDYDKARQLLDEAAGMGDPRAIGLLSVFPSLGITEPIDKQSAYSYNLDAAKRGLSRSQYNVCVQSIHGIGVSKDTATGASFCQTATQNTTDPVAQNFFGWLLETGIGVSSDIPAAMKFYELASEGQYRLASLNLARLEISNARSTTDALDTMAEALSKYLSSEFNPILDDVYWVYEINPSEIEMIDRFIEACEILLEMQPHPELREALSSLKQGRDSGRFPRRIYLQPAIGSYVK
ncbi:MAG: toll/interleukin-1 receptor domain-containing protein [Henriciella sp.]